MLFHNIARVSANFMRYRFITLLQNRNITTTDNSCVEHDTIESENKNEKVRIVFISDTHSDHEKLGKLPYGDILVHAGIMLIDFTLKCFYHLKLFLGDFTQTRPSKPDEYKEFIDWYSSQPHKHKLLISGNRDGFMDTKNSLKVKKIIFILNETRWTFLRVKLD